MATGAIESYDEYAALLDAVRGIRWPARTAVRGGIPGAHTSRLRGISAEFTEYRPYRQGDDLRRIDWKLFARSDRAYIRLSNDRAILPTMIVLDASASMAFPVDTHRKWKLAAQVGIALGAVARNSGDPVGLVIAGDEPLMLAPRMRRSVTHEIIRSVSAARPGGSEPLSPSVSIAAQSGGRLVIVTDFLGAVADKSNQPVFIHCGSANRVGAMWMIKRALQDGWTVERAQAEAEAIGLQNPQLKEFATNYIKEHPAKK